MIHYALRCASGHGFDGWFSGSASFEAQAAAGQVECPSCGSARVERALMAPALARGSVEVVPAEPKVAAVEGMPAEVRAALQKLRAAVEKHCDYVGPDFADQALRMHRGEAPARAIYGETQPEEAERLIDEGVEIARVPWVERADG